MTLFHKPGKIGLIGQQRNIAGLGVFLGIILGPIEWVIVALCGDLREKCPECGGVVVTGVRKCKNCGSDLPQTQTPSIQEPPR